MAAKNKKYGSSEMKEILRKRVEKEKNYRHREEKAKLKEEKQLLAQEIILLDKQLGEKK